MNGLGVPVVRVEDQTRRRRAYVGARNTYGGAAADSVRRERPAAPPPPARWKAGRAPQCRKPDECGRDIGIRRRAGPRAQGPDHRT